jgi:fumarylacetoacetate (FAA) hydrolase
MHGSCRISQRVLSEARVRQVLAGVHDARLQRYLQHGDRVHIEVRDPQGRSLFGAIDQRVVIPSGV